MLVIGASSGYGLAARITAAFGWGAATLGVFREKPARRRKTATAGWYNAAAFQREAAGLAAPQPSLNADAFADGTRARTIEFIRDELGGPVDLVIYSLAAPARTLPDSGETVQAVIKPVGETFYGHTIDTDADALVPLSLAPATDAEIDATVKVMGGEDWRLWLEALDGAGVLADDARSVAFSYLGPELTWPIYRDGSIGRAKADLEETARAMSAAAGRADFARVAVLKSIVTQASAAIPSIPLYLSVVGRVLQDRGLDEDALDQQLRLFAEHLYPAGQPLASDEAGRLRLDERELAPEVQAAAEALWARLDGDNFAKLADYAGYKRAFLGLYGFGREDVDYGADVDAVVAFEPYTV